jgi:hypothetical protein
LASVGPRSRPINRSKRGALVPELLLGTSLPAEFSANTPAKSGSSMRSWAGLAGLVGLTTAPPAGCFRSEDARRAMSTLERLLDRTLEQVNLLRGIHQCPCRHCKTQAVLSRDRYIHRMMPWRWHPSRDVCLVKLSGCGRSSLQVDTGGGRPLHARWRLRPLQ